MKRRTILAAVATLATASAAAEPVTVPFDRAFPAFAERPVLEGERDTATLAFHLPGDWAAGAASLRLALRTGADVMPERSGLTMSVNGKPLALLPLRAADRPLAVELGLPPGLLQPGRNLLTLEAQQAHRVSCGRSAAYQLWTRIDMQRSGMRFTPGEHQRPSHDAVLADPRAAGDAIEILLPAGGLTESMLGIGAFLAQAIALRLEGAAQRVVLRTFQPAGGGGALPGLPAAAFTGRRPILIGSAGLLAPVIGENVAGTIAAPFLATMQDATGRPVLVISGRTDREVAAAMTGLAPAGAPQAVLGSGETRALGTLGYVETGATTARHAVEVRLSLPPDALLPFDEPLLLTLGFSYGPGLAAHAALDVYINGEWGGRVALDRSAGAVRDGVRVAIPARLLRPGDNRLMFDARLPPAEDGDCLPADTGGPRFMLSADSTLRLPRFIRAGRAPNLRLLADDAYPLTGPAGPATMLVAGGAPATVSAAWTLAARLAQARGAPLVELHWRLGTGAPSQTRNLLMIGPYGALPADALAAAALQLPKRMPAAPPAARSGAASDAIAVLLRQMDGRPPMRTASLPDVAGRSLRQSWAERLPGLNDGASGERELTARLADGIREIRASLDPDAPHRARRAAERRMAGGAGLLGGYAAADGTVLHIVTAATPELLQTRVEQLVGPQLWARLAGDIAVWNDAESIQTGQVGTRRFLGAPAITPSSAAILGGHWAADHPLQLVGVILASLLLFSGATWLILLARRRRLFHDV